LVQPPAETPKSEATPDVAVPVAVENDDKPPSEESSSEAEDIPDMNFAPTAQVFNVQTPHQQREQEKLRKLHENDNRTHESTYQAVKLKRANIHKSSSLSIEKQQDKEMAVQRKEGADRPTKLNAQHAVEQKNLAKEMDLEFKNVIAGHKKAMKAWLGDQQAELKNKISILKAQYKKDKATLKSKKVQLEGEAKIRQQDFQDKDLLVVTHQYQDMRSKKERDMETEHLHVTLEMELSLQQEHHRLDRKHLQDLHTEQLKQNQEVQEDEKEMFTIRLPMEDGHFHAQVDLDQHQLTAQQEREMTELNQQIANQQKLDRKEYGKKKKLQEKEYQTALKQFKKSKDKAGMQEEKDKFVAQMETQDEEFEDLIEDQADKKIDGLESCHQQQEKEMKEAHKATEEQLQQQHAVAKKQMEKRHLNEVNMLESKQQQENKDLCEKLHKEATILQKRQHDQTRATGREHYDSGLGLFEKHYQEMKDLLHNHNSEITASPHCTLTDQEKKEEDQHEEKSNKDREALTQELDMEMSKMEEKLVAAANELAAEHKDMELIGGE